jgi:hypothetical protein
MIQTQHAAEDACVIRSCQTAGMSETSAIHYPAPTTRQREIIVPQYSSFHAANVQLTHTSLIKHLGKTIQ